MLAELARRGTPFVGLLYAGLMLTEDGPRVLEFNCRFGDPETQAVLPVIGDDLLEPFVRAASGDLAGVELAEPERAAVTVVVASPGYPDAPVTGAPIGGIDDAEDAGALVFHAGTALRDGELVSAGGRVLGITGLGDTLADARGRAYDAAACIQLSDAQYRRDIAEAAIHVTR